MQRKRDTARRHGRPMLTAALWREESRVGRIDMRVGLGGTAYRLALNSIVLVVISMAKNEYCKLLRLNHARPIPVQVPIGLACFQLAIRLDESIAEAQQFLCFELLELSACRARVASGLRLQVVQLDLETVGSAKRRQPSVRRDCKPNLPINHRDHQLSARVSSEPLLHPHQLRRVSLIGVSTTSNCPSAPRRRVNVTPHIATCSPTAAKTIFSNGNPRSPECSTTCKTRGRRETVAKIHQFVIRSLNCCLRRDRPSKSQIPGWSVSGDDQTTVTRHFAGRWVGGHAQRKFLPAKGKMDLLDGFCALTPPPSPCSWFTACSGVSDLEFVNRQSLGWPSAALTIRIR
ncbi:hypothetical protein IWX46DRAFT_665915 [Phyllosticta citricarpa]|uniref:Uncharacterized protein n=1 Tax=Phyllosticta citricarpa TaxID=55181 RepID=A0ABR1LR54_9PEZI